MAASDTGRLVCRCNALRSLEKEDTDLRTYTVPKLRFLAKHAAVVFVKLPLIDHLWYAPTTHQYEEKTCQRYRGCRGGGDGGANGSGALGAERLQADPVHRIHGVKK